MANLKLTCPANAELSVRRIGSGDWANAKDQHHIIGRGAANELSSIARALVNFREPEWPAAGRLVRATLSGWTGATGAHGNFRGNNPRLEVRRNTERFREESGGQSAENVWTTSAPNLWPGVGTAQSIEFNVPGEANKSWSVDVTAIVNNLLPKRILRSASGAEGGNQKWFGFTIRSVDEGAANRSAILWTRRGNMDRRMVLEIVIDTAATPSSPAIVRAIGAVEGTSDPTVVATLSGRELAVEFGFRSEAAGDTCSKAKLDWHGPTATDEAPGPVEYTTGWVTPAERPGANQHSITLTGVPFRREGRFRVTTQSNKNKTGDPSSLEDALAHVRLATIGRAPINVTLQGYTTDALLAATIDSADPTDYVTGYEAELYERVAGQLTPVWLPGLTEIGGTSTRRIAAVVPVQMRHNANIEFRVRLRNRDGVLGAWSGWLDRVVRDRVGPTLTPTDGLLYTRTPTYTIADASFDGHQLWLRQLDGTLIWTSGLLTESAATSRTVAVPAGTLAFGQPFTATAATRPASSGSLGPESEPQTYTVTSLPTVAQSVPGWRRGQRLRTTDIPVLRTVTDADGDQPEAVETEWRVAADPQGSGALIERRYDAAADGAIPRLARTGRRIDLLTSAAGWAADANVTAGTGDQQPTGYSGNSLELAFASSASGRGATYTFDPPLDLSGFGPGALIRLHRRITSVTNIGNGMYLAFEDHQGLITTHQIVASGAATNTWAEVVARMGDPVYEDAGFDLSIIPEMQLYVFQPSGSFAGTLHARDLRIGTVRTAKDTPDGHVAFETSVDIRSRARDAAVALASTTLSGTEAAGQTALSVTSSSGMAAGQSVVVGGAIPEVREIATVDSGSQITVTEALSHDHASGAAVVAYPFGPRSGWTTVPVAQPPDVALLSPSDTATVTRPWPTFTWDTTAYGGRSQASAAVHVERVTEDGTEPFVVLDVAGPGETATIPVLLLDDATEYAWHVVVTDDAGMTGTSAVRTFETAFTAPAALDVLNAVPVPSESLAELSWSPSDDPDLAFYALEHLQGDTWVRIDGGPETAGDGRPPLLATTFHHTGAWLGTNAWRVSAHNGWAASEPVSTDAELQWPAPGAWPLVREGLVVPLQVTRASRLQSGRIESFGPPGGQPRHVSWGPAGRSIRLEAFAIPSEDGDLASVLRRLLGSAVWLKAPPGYVWGALWGVATESDGRAGPWGDVVEEIEFVETADPVHGFVPAPDVEDEEEPPAVGPVLSIDLDLYDFGDVEMED